MTSFEVARELNVDHGDAVILARSFCPSGHGTGAHGSTCPCHNCTERAIRALAEIRRPATPTGDAVVTQDVEHVERLLFNLRQLLDAVIKPATEPIRRPGWADDDTGEAFEALEQFRLLVFSNEPFVSLQRVADRIDDYCRPTCGSRGTPHPGASPDVPAGTVHGPGGPIECTCPCHPRFASQHRST